MPENTQPKNYKEQFDRLISDMLDSAVTKQEVFGAIKSLTDIVKSAQRQMVEKTAQTKSETEKEVKKLEEKLAAFQKKLNTAVDQKEAGLVSRFDKEIKELRDYVIQVEDMIMYYDDTELRKAITSLQETVSALPETPEEFDPSDILKELKTHKDLIEDLKKRPVGSGGGTRRVFQPYLDRFQGDGNTKVFYLKREPLRTDNIEVWGTDFPIVLDPDNDFTVTGKTLTLTSSVDTPTNGAIIVVKYYA